MVIHRHWVYYTLHQIFCLWKYEGNSASLFRNSRRAEMAEQIIIRWIIWPLRLRRSKEVPEVLYWSSKEDSGSQTSSRSPSPPSQRLLLQEVTLSHLPPVSVICLVAHSFPAGMSSKPSHGLPDSALGLIGHWNWDSKGTWNILPAICTFLINLLFTFYRFRHTPPKLPAVPHSFRRPRYLLLIDFSPC